MIGFSMHPTRFMIRIATIALLAAIGAIIPAASAQVVKKLADGFEGAGWKSSPFATAPGSVSISDDVAPDSGSSKHSLLIEARFAGTFGGFGGSPNQPLIKPKPYR